MSVAKSRLHSITLARTPCLRRLQLLAKLQYQFVLLGSRSDEFKAMQKSHAVPHHRSHDERFRNVWNREFQRNHLSRHQLAGNYGAQPGLRNFKTPAVYPNVPVRPQHFHNHRYLRAIAGVSPGRRLARSLSLEETVQKTLAKFVH